MIPLMLHIHQPITWLSEFQHEVQRDILRSRRKVKDTISRIAHCMGLFDGCAKVVNESFASKVLRYKLACPASGSKKRLSAHRIR